MILRFPSRETLHSALALGLLPDEVAAAPTEHCDEPPEFIVKTDARIDRATLHRLRQHGVTQNRRNVDGPWSTANCWAEMVPLIRLKNQDVGQTVPLMFVFRDEAMCHDYVWQLLRLGVETQSLSRLTLEQQSRWLLKTLVAPMYVMLRALESPHDVTVHYEQQPNAWVPVGYRHPQLPPRFDCPVLINSNAQWIPFARDTEFTPIQNVLQFSCPTELQWQPRNLETRIPVTLKLLPDPASHPADLWILDGPPNVAMATLLAHESHIRNGLQFAMLRQEDRESVLLRGRSDALTTLGFDAQPFRRYRSLPNCFLPLGRRLYPPLTRELLTDVLRLQPDDVVWLSVGTDDQTVVNRVAESAFHSLSEWVDYRLEQDRPRIDAWIASHSFDFTGLSEDYIEDSKPVQRPRNKKTTTQPTRATAKSVHESTPATPSDSPEHGIDRKDEASLATAIDTPMTAQSDGKELLQQYKRALETENRDVKRALAHELWQNALRTGTSAQAAFWLIELHWEFPINNEAFRQDIESWLDTHGEHETLAQTLESAMRQRAAFTGSNELAFRILLDTLPDGLDASKIVTGKVEEIRTTWTIARKSSSLRVNWLVECALAHTTRDLLMLAQEKNRLLTALFRVGLSSGRDVPQNLLSSTAAPTWQQPLPSTEYAQLHDRVRKWVQEPAETAQTRLLVDRLFAFGYATLGDTEFAVELLAEDTPPDLSDAQLWLHKALGYRIQQRCDGVEDWGAWPTTLHTEYHTFEKFTRYRIDLVRQHSRILEPNQRLHPLRQKDDAGTQLINLFQNHPQNEAEVQRLITACTSYAQLQGPMSVAAWQSENLARQLFEQSLAHLPKFSLTDQIHCAAQLLEIASRFDNPDRERELWRTLSALAPEWLARSTSEDAKPTEVLTAFQELYRQAPDGSLANELGLSAGLRELSRKFNGKSPLRKTLKVRLLLLNVPHENEAGCEDALRQAEQLLAAGTLPLVHELAIANELIGALRYVSPNLRNQKLRELLDLKRQPRLFENEFNRMTSAAAEYSVYQLACCEAIVHCATASDQSIRADNKSLDRLESATRRRIHSDMQEAINNLGD